jgi:hypothetical protein
VKTLKIWPTVARSARRPVQSRPAQAHDHVLAGPDRFDGLDGERPGGKGCGDLQRESGWLQGLRQGRLTLTAAVHSRSSGSEASRAALVLA